MRLNFIGKLIMKCLILATATVASANFGGFSMTETPLSSMEVLIDKLIHETKLDQRYLKRPSHLYGIKKALLKGCSQDYTLLRTLSQQTLTASSGNSNEESDIIRQDLVISTARIYGYLE